MLMGLCSVASLAAETQNEVQVFSDMPDNWSTEALQNAVANGLLKGTDGKILPNDNLTRAQMAAVIVRAFGASVKGDISAFPDVKASNWFADDMAKAYQMGVIKGSDGKMEPNSAITRQEVFIIIARALKLQSSETINKTFADQNKISDWAKGEVYALVNAGYIKGENGKLNPQDLITRAQFAQVLDNIIKQYINKAGEVTEVSDGNVMVNVPSVTLKDLTVNGDLIIGDGVGNGEVTLDNVTVTGRMVVRGGGENSIIIRGSSSVSNVIVARTDGAVSVKVEGDANVEVIYIDDGSDDVNIEGTVGNIDLNADGIVLSATSANITSIDISGTNTKVVVAADSKIETVRVLAGAANAKLEVSGNVTTVTTKASGTAVTGSGTVTKVEAQEGANGAKIQTPKTEIVVSANVSGVTGGGGTKIEGGSTTTNNETGTGLKTTPASQTGGSGNGGSSNVLVTGISLSDETVQAGSTLQMSANISPASATNQTVSWSVTNGTGAASISSSGLLSAISVGTVTVTATASDGSGVSGSATVTITAVPDANLTGLVLSGTANDFTFASNTYQYSGVYVPHNQSSITVMPTLDGATITVNGVAVASGTDSSAINLAAAEEKTITVAVTKAGHTSKTYTIEITRIPVWSQGSSIGDITLEPSSTITYGPESGTYTINGDLIIQGDVDGTVTLQNIRVTGDLTINTPNATITVLASVVIEGNTNLLAVADHSFWSNGIHSQGIGVQGGGSINLGGSASNTLLLILTPQPVILGGNIGFVQVQQTGAQLTLGGTVGSLFVQQNTVNIINGGSGSVGTLMITGGLGDPTLTGWGATPPPITVAAENLNGLTISPGTLSPVFSGSTYLYTATVGNAVNSITVSPVAAVGTTAVVKVDGAEQPGGVVGLDVGDNTITIEVSQAGRSTITYTLLVKRQAAPPATPTITPASGAVAFGTTLTLTSAGADYIFYTTDGSDPLAGVSGTTKVYNSSAKPVINSAMTVKAIAIKAGSPNSAIASASYTQAASADLTNIALSGTPSNFTFSGSTYTYNGVTVGNDIASITVTPTGAGTITVDGTALASGSTSVSLALTAGVERTITVVATETGKTVKTYVIKVTRVLNGDATVATTASNYTVNNTLNTIAANETFINTTTTVGAFLGNLTKNEYAQWKVLPSTVPLEDVDNFNEASARINTATLEIGDVLAVMAQDGTIKIYAIAVTEPLATNLNVIIPDQDGVVIGLYKTVGLNDSAIAGLIIGDFTLIKDFGLPGEAQITGISLYVDPLGGTFEYEILPPAGQIFAAGDYRLVFYKDGYQTAHEDFTILDATVVADNADIAAAQGSIEAASYTAAQAEAGTSGDAEDKAQALVDALSLHGTTAVVVPGTFTAAIAGTVGDLDGTDGSFTFTVSVSKGGGTTVTTVQRTMAITATPYDATQDNADIAAAQGSIEAASYTAAQAEAGNAGAAATKAQALVDALALHGTTAVVVPGTFTAAIAGTVGDPDGSDGSFTFTVSVGKGGGTPITSAQKTMSITATAYDATQDNADITAAKTALETAATLNPVEGTDNNVISMAQAIVTNGVVVAISSADGNSKVNADGTINYAGAAVTGNVVFNLNKGLGTQQTATMSVVVPAGNFPPTGTDQTSSATENIKYTLDLTTIFSDDRDASADLTYTVVGDNGAAVAALAAGGKILEYTPSAADIDNAVVITVNATDTESAMSENVTITLNVEAAEFAGGSGTSANPWQISTPLHLNNIRNYLGDASGGKYFILVNDIDLTDFLGEGGPEYNDGAGWRPIGNDLSGVFKGVLLGNGKTISNLYINRPGENDVGLFGSLYNGCIIENLALENVNIAGRYCVGSIAGKAAHGIIRNVGVTGNLSGTQHYVGGIVGDHLSNNVLINSYAHMNVSAAFDYVGGIVGRHSSTATIQNCYAVGTVSGRNLVRGLASGNTSNGISNSYYDSTVSGLSETGWGEPRTTAQMLQQSNYQGWDFAAAWGINAAENSGYPFLRWQGYTHISNDATLATMTVGGQDVMELPGLEISNPADDGAELAVDDFTGFAGITATSSDAGAEIVVTLNGGIVNEADLATQPITENDVIVIAVTAADDTSMKYYKVTAVAGAIEIAGYDALADVNAGTAGSATFSSAAEVMTYLGTNRATVTITGTAVTVPLTGWTDTDTYNPSVAGSYTFTAQIGPLPDGYVDEVDVITAVTVEVIVTDNLPADLASLTENLTADFDPAFAGGTYVYALAAASDQDGVGLTATLEGATITYSYAGQAGKVVASGTIESIPLTVGANTITIEVAKAGLQTVTYTITVTKAAPFEAGSGGTIGTYTDFVPEANTFGGFYIDKTDRESDGFGGIRSVIDMLFPSPESNGATKYTLQSSNDGGTSWSNFQYNSEEDLVASSAQDNFSLNLSGIYKFRLLASGGPIDGYVSNVVDVTAASTPSSNIDTRFSSWGLDESMMITGTMIPWVGRGLEASFTVQTVPDYDTVSDALTYQWYRLNPATFAMTPIADANGLTYTTTMADIGYRLMIRATGDGINANGFIQEMSRWEIVEPNYAYLSDISASGFTLNLEKAANLTVDDLTLEDGSAAPIVFSLAKVNDYTYDITADIAAADYSFWLVNNSSFWRIASAEMPGHLNEGIGCNLSPTPPLSDNATLASATIKGVAAASLGSQSDDINSISAGSATINSSQATSAVLSTEFAATHASAVTKAVKYVQGVTDFSGFDGASAYNNEVITNGDFFIIKVTAEDGTTVSYYKIDIMILSPVTESVITGIPVPVAGDTPVGAATNSAQYAGVVTWTPEHNPFQAGTEYTATITLTAAEGYTFDGVAENFFSVAGATTVTYVSGSNLVTAVFPATAPLVPLPEEVVITQPASGEAPGQTKIAIGEELEFRITNSDGSVEKREWIQGLGPALPITTTASPLLEAGDKIEVRVKAVPPIPAGAVYTYSLTVDDIGTASLPGGAITNANVSIAEGSIIFTYTFEDNGIVVTYGEAVNAPYLLDPTTSTVTLTDGTNSTWKYLDDLGISLVGTVSYMGFDQLNAVFSGELNFVPGQILLHLTGANGTDDPWVRDFAVTLDSTEIALFSPDSTPPTITAAVQSATNEVGQTVTARSNELGSVFILLDGEAHATQADFQAALTASKASAAAVTTPDTDVNISTTGLTGGTYYAYAVDSSGNISAPGSNAITITQILTPGSTNKLVLSAALSEAGTNISSVVTSADGTDVYAVYQWVVSEAMTVYETAISAAQAVADNGLATQTQIDSAVSALAAATVTFDNAKQQGTKLCVTSVTLRNVTDAVTATPGVPLAANIGDVLEITAVTVSDGESAAGRVEYIVSVRDPVTMEQLGTININPTQSSFTIPETYTHVDTTQHSINGTLIHFGARLLTDENSGVAATAGPIESDLSGATVTPSTTTPEQGEPFLLDITSAKGIDGSNLTGEINVVITSSDTTEGSAGTLYNAAANFSNGMAAITVTLANPGAQTLTVQVNGVTAYQTVNVTVGASEQTPAPLSETLSVNNGAFDYVSIVNLDSDAYHIRVYNAASGGDLIAETFLQSDFHYDSGTGTYYTESIITGSLNSAGGTVWVTLQADGKTESARTEVSYPAEI